MGNRNQSTWVTLAVLLVVTILLTSGSYWRMGPSRRKFKKLPGGTEDLTVIPEAPPEADPMKDIVGDKRFKEWIAWWKTCVPTFGLGSLYNMGVFAPDRADIPFKPMDKLKKGPAKMFYVRGPGGKRILNPFYGRLQYKMEKDGWQPLIELPCGAAVYEPKEKKAYLIFKCWYQEGIQDGFWLSKDRLVLMGYESVSRQMDADCPTVESCVAPSVWIVDLAKDEVHQYRGDALGKAPCDLTGYFKLRLPKFFGK